MTAARVAWARVRGLFGAAERDRDLSDEIAAHLDLLTAEHMRRGMSRAEARAAARGRVLPIARSRNWRRSVATVEEGIGLPSAGPRGERLLPVQVDHRAWPSIAQSNRTED